MAVPAQKSIEREREREVLTSPPKGTGGAVLLLKKKKVSLKNFLLQIPEMVYHAKIREGHSYLTQKEDSTELDSRNQHPAAPSLPSDFP